MELFALSFLVLFLELMVDPVGSRAAHTDGDTIVYFPNADVIMTGDFYRSISTPISTAPTAAD